MTPEPLALFIPSMAGGGAERVVLTLAGAIASRGHKVDLVLAKAEGPYVNDVPPGVRVVDLGASRAIGSLPALVRYLRRERPLAMASALDYANVIAVWAVRLSRTGTRLVIVEHNTLSIAARNDTSRRGRWMPKLAARFYGWADMVAGVSKGVAQDLQAVTELPSVEVLPNPAVFPGIEAKASVRPDHPWFDDHPPVVAVGRLDPQKDYGTLIEAVALARRSHDLRLIILGEGPERARLEETIERLGLESAVCLPGFVDNPYSYMAHATALVMSSIYEGLPTVLIEGLRCGVPVISTDCPSGPREILGDGRFGRLVPVGDVEALASALGEAERGILPEPPSESWEPYELERVTSRYLDALIGGAT